MRNVLLIVFCLVLCQMIAQPPTRFYTKFGTGGDDIGYSVKPTLDGHYIVVGSTTGFGSTDVYMIKVDSMGLPIWSRTFGGINNDVGKSVIQLSDSGYVIAGFTSSFGAGGYDAYLIRTDKYGNQVWQKTFGGTDWDFANDLVLTSDGNIAVVGHTSSYGSGSKDGLVLIYDISGNLITQKFYGGVENEELRSIISTNDGFLATVGYTESNGDIDGDIYFLKLDLNADSLFAKKFGGQFKDYATDVIQKSSGDYVICGSRTFSVNTKMHSAMISISASGNFFWENEYYASQDDETFTSLCNSYQLPYLTAYIRNVPVPAFDLQGNIFVGSIGGYNYKVNSFGGSNWEYFNSVEGTDDGGFVVIGSTTSFNSLGQDIFFMKHDSTCFNYTSVVGIPKVKENTKTIYYHDDYGMSLEFSETNPVIEAYLIDVSGRILEKLGVYYNKISFNLNNVPASIYILRCKFKDGEIFYHKLIKN